MKRIIKIIIKILILLIILATIIFLYSKYINPIGFKVNERTIYSKDLPKEFDGLKIVQISDIHYGTTIKNHELTNIVNHINLTKPDIVFFTGDLINKRTDLKDKDKSYIIEQLKNINSTIDKYYISGNNDYNNPLVENIMNEANFINLNDYYQIIHKNKSSILISGLSTRKNINKDKLTSTTDYLNNNHLYSILIMHEPDNVQNIDYNKFNIILAGHSLGGQFRLPVIGGLIHKKGSSKYINDHYSLKTTDLYISNGLGNDNIEYRFLNKPSFNLFRLRNK